MAAPELHSLRQLFQFLDRMNTTMFEVEITSDFPDRNIRDIGVVIQTKTTINIRSVANLERAFVDIQTEHIPSHINHISFTNVILSGTIDLLKKSVNIIFHTVENIENILHQLIDIQIPTFELNLKLLHPGLRRPPQS